MQYTEAQFLFTGATVLHELTPLRVTELTRCAGGDLAALLVPADGGPAGRAARLHVFDPEDTVSLSTEHTVRWTVHYRERSHRRSGYTSTELSAPYTVRSHWPYKTPHMVVTRLVEHHRTIAAVPVALADLPGPGVPREVTPEGGKVFYRRLNGGPSVLATGDDVRFHLTHMQDVHDGEHRRQRRLPVHDPQMSRCRLCVLHPYELTVLRVTVTGSNHDIDVEDLPDCQYALDPEASYRRVTGQPVAQPPQPATGRPQASALSFSSEGH
ncbi:hypothetical protein OG871_40445 (plasmid) [Kitasatospora sp. NBC_00374]|uniref:hypothetical protein n=1 Tax=Kitasatospora sp. NBC_00374 TaxID=2975964 RepID=UPI002F9150BB